MESYVEMSILIAGRAYTSSPCPEGMSKVLYNRNEINL